MTTIQEESIQRAIKFLNAAGAKYRIVYGEQVWDTLPVATTRGPRPDYKSVYGPVLEGLKKEGEHIAKIEVPQEFDLEHFRGAVASQLVREFGKGNTMTVVNKETRVIDILRT